MKGILEEILQYKRVFVENSKKKLPLRELEHLVLTSDETRDFTGALSENGCSLIAEIKTASPSKGLISDDVDIEDIARIYSANGAACISVLTDEKYFMGSLESLSRIRNVTIGVVMFVTWCMCQTIFIYLLMMRSSVINSIRIMNRIVDIVRFCLN